MPRPLIKPVELHLVVGGEGMSEGLRNYFSRWFKSVFSSYGASDLEINIGAETPFSVALRQLCWTSPTFPRRSSAGKTADGFSI